MRWPWQPREYVAVVEALRYAEEALHRQRVAAARQRGVMAEVADELKREDSNGSG